MIEQLLAYDRELFLFLNGLGTDTWDWFWMAYTTKFNWIPLYALLLFLIYKNYRKKHFILIVLVTVALIAFTDQVTNLFKHGFERLRPCHEEELQGIMRLVKEYCGGRYGFFSGHASNSMAAAVFSGLLLRTRYKYLIFLMLFWAAAMAYSRIYIGVHYPIDAICGMTFGALSGFTFYKLSRIIASRFISD